MVDFFVADVSEFQSNVDFAAVAAAGYGVICRVCYGTRRDNIMPARRDAARAARLPYLGWYLFLRASQDIAAQVATFTGIIPALRPGEQVWIDWENDLSAPAPTVAQVQQALNLLDAHYRQPTGLYGNPSTLVHQPAGHPDWVASYETAEPGGTHELWQFTDGRYKSIPYGPQVVPGIGLCDLSVHHGGVITEATIPAAQPAAQFVVGPVTQLTDSTEGAMQTQEFTLTTDDRGNGSAIFDGGASTVSGVTSAPVKILWSQYVAVAAQSSCPPVDGGYWGHGAHPAERGGFLLVSVTGGPANGQANVVVTTTS